MLKHFDGRALRRTTLMKSYAMAKRVQAWSATNGTSCGPTGVESWSHDRATPVTSCLLNLAARAVGDCRSGPETRQWRGISVSGTLHDIAPAVPRLPRDGEAVGEFGLRQRILASMVEKQLGS